VFVAAIPGPISNNETGRFAWQTPATPGDDGPRHRCGGLVGAWPSRAEVTWVRPDKLGALAGKRPAPFVQIGQLGPAREALPAGNVASRNCSVATARIAVNISAQQLVHIRSRGRKCGQALGRDRRECFVAGTGVDPKALS